MEHSPGFLKLVTQQRPYVKEITVEQALERLVKNPELILMDVREDKEWEREHATKAIHLSKGIMERDIERTIPDLEREIIMYCGGGYRSVLTASSAQNMGYRNVYSLMGGYRAMVRSNWPMKKGSGDSPPPQH
jgi:rhodanese-related sulfurtransferase